MKNLKLIIFLFSTLLIIGLVIFTNDPQTYGMTVLAVVASALAATEMGVPFEGIPLKTVLFVAILTPISVLVCLSIGKPVNDLVMFGGPFYALLSSGMLIYGLVYRILYRGSIADQKN